jgi:hypothetical protein
LFGPFIGWVLRLRLCGFAPSRVMRHLRQGAKPQIRKAKSMTAFTMGPHLFPTATAPAGGSPVKHVRAFVLVGTIGFAYASAIGATVAPATQWTPPTPTNLQVLDKSTAARDVIGVMKGFTQGLGVRCQHCLVVTGDDPNNLAAFDFASDEKPAKRTARTMMRMTAAINNEHLESVGTPPPAGEARVTCYTCHRGDVRPLAQRPPS